jgi:hypothetical protein
MVVKTTTPMAEMQVEAQSFRLRIVCNWYNTKISPAAGKAANTHAMEKCMVVEKEIFIADAVTTPWYNKNSEKVVTRMTTTLPSFRRTESGNRATRLSMLT